MGFTWSSSSGVSQSEVNAATTVFNTWPTIGIRGPFSESRQHPPLPPSATPTDYKSDGVHDLTFEQFRAIAPGKNFKPGKYGFLLLPNHHIRFASESPTESAPYHGDQWGHTSLLSQADYNKCYGINGVVKGPVVKWAGEYKVNAKGKIVAISNDSGHFLPRGHPNQIGHFLAVLNLKGVTYTEKHDSLTHKYEIDPVTGEETITRRDTNELGEPIPENPIPVTPAHQSIYGSSLRRDFSPKETERVKHQRTHSFGHSAAQLAAHDYLAYDYFPEVYQPQQLQQQPYLVGDDTADLLSVVPVASVMLLIIALCLVLYGLVAVFCGAAGYVVGRKRNEINVGRDEKDIAYSEV